MRTNTLGNTMRLCVSLSLFVTIGLSQPLLAVEGIPHWEQVLNEVLQRAEQEQRSKPPHAPDLPGPPDVAAHRRILHPLVEHSVSYFQGAGQNQYRASVNRLQAYRAMILRVFREEGLPPELVWIGLVESGYDPSARSPANAAGIWQLIPETAATFGLTVARADERFDPEKSTRAAARYLKSLYATFGDWALVLAAYNAGQQRVQSAIDRVHNRDFWSLSASGLLPRETRGYVPAVLAAQFLGEERLENTSRAHDAATGPAAKIAVAPFALSP